MNIYHVNSDMKIAQYLFVDTSKEKEFFFINFGCKKYTKVCLYTISFEEYRNYYLCHQCESSSLVGGVIVILL